MKQTNADQPMFREASFEFDPDYVPHADKVIARHAAWWKNECIDRPVVYLTFQGETSRGLRPEWPATEVKGVGRHVDPEFRLALTEYMLDRTRYFGDAIPAFTPGLNIAYTATLARATVSYTNTDWIEPTVFDWDNAPEPKFDVDEPVMKRLIETTRMLAENSRGRYIMKTPDYVDCVSSMSEMRGAQDFCMDLVDQPEKVVRYRDAFIEAYLDSAAFWNRFIRDYGYPGTTNWTGVLSTTLGNQIQCDFSVMIGREMFHWLVMPEQRREAEYFGDNLYHLDGPGQIQHLDALLEIPQIKAIQWVPIAGSDKPTSGHWIPLLQRIQQAGKALQVYARADELDLYKEHLKPEGLFLHFNMTQQPALQSEADCEQLMKEVEKW
jgi:5-methyltetrahydrofolate--homocysteine methyltransferase